MPFDSTGVVPTIIPDPARAEWLLSWTSTAPAGTIFQVYINNQLFWHGTARRLAIPWPKQRASVRIGAVAVGESATDFSATLPAIPGGGWYARLAWYGGRFESDQLAGFHVYGATAPGGTVDFTRTLATIPACSIAGQWRDGAGVGPAGVGGAGRAALSYAWRSAPLAPGAWSFAVVPFDQAGDEGPATTLTVTISSPPLPPAPQANGQRLSYSFDSATRIATLSWLASPG